MAVATLVNRTALPVLARVASARSQVAEILAWALARSATLVAPLMAALALAAGPLTMLLHDHEGHSYAAAAAPLVVTAERTDRYAPQPGDLICLGRSSSRALTYDDLPTGSFPGHCDIVVAATPGQLTVIGGNVDDTVTEKHIPTTPAGTLADASGVVDARYPWFVVLRVLYDS